MSSMELKGAKTTREQNERIKYDYIKKKNTAREPQKIHCPK